MYSNLVSEKIFIPLEDGSFTAYINFDNAATSPPLIAVIDEINNFLPYYSSVHRGTGYKSIISSNYYEGARESVLDFVSAPQDHIAIFTNNTTEAINKLAYSLEDTIGNGRVLVTEMEHHSNLLPWWRKYPIDYVRVNKEGRLDLDHLEYLLEGYRGRVKLVAVSGASNVTGYINPIYDIAKICHKYGAKILVDGAQLVPHCPINMDGPEAIDFLAFSGHKAYAPFGTGVLIGPKKFLARRIPRDLGGGTVKLVTKKEIIWADLPYREEAGTPNLLGVLALAKALDSLWELGMDKILDYEQKLTQYALDQMKEIPRITLYDDCKVDEKVPIISFNLDGLHHEEVAGRLSAEGQIGVRNGCFCAQPYVHKLLGISLEDIEILKADKTLPRPGMVRASFGLYNSYEEVDRFIEILKRIY